MSSGTKLVIIGPTAPQITIVDTGAVLRGSDVQTTKVLKLNDGTPGAPGVVEDYVHNQPSAALVWTIDHGLGRKPHIVVYGAGGQELVAEILHISVYQAQVSFVVQTAGTARCI